MKKFLAILALVGVVLALPLAAIANDDFDGQGEAEGLCVPPDGERGEGDPIEQDNQGDPDELGGGFRGSGSPPDSNGAGGPGFWVMPLIVLMMQLV